ncbi:MAG: hypothetical protein V4722_15155 [Bacteroidota bacterium]
MSDTHFYNTIYNLRSNGEITLFERLLTFEKADEDLVVDFLQLEYEAEAQNYPYTAPVYDGAAALWGAKTTYNICQLILCREHKVAELPGILPAFTGPITAGTILSADLCLRLLPQVLADTRHIDPEDSLVELAENILQQWHYSGIGYSLPVEKMEWEPVLSDNCLFQLYADRVIEKKDQQRATQPMLNQKIRAAMGIYAPHFWKTFNY